MKKRPVHKGVWLTAMGDDLYMSLCNDYSYEFEHTEWLWKKVTCRRCLAKRKGGKKK